MYSPALFLALTYLLAPHASALHVFMLGNSFTAGLPDIVSSLLSTHLKPQPVMVDAKIEFSWRLDIFVKDSMNPKSTLNTTSFAPGMTYDYVVIQEQSGLPGLYDPQANMDRPLWRSSLSSTTFWSEKAVAAGAVPVLFATWAGPQGDDDWKAFYPDYATMQDRTTAGYYMFQERISRDVGIETLIAPVGAAFAIVYAADTAGLSTVAALFNWTSELMVEEETPPVSFLQLYKKGKSGPDKHANSMGQYLAALVISGTISGDCLVGKQYNPVPEKKDTSMTPEQQQYLQAVACQALQTPKILLGDSASKSVLEEMGSIYSVHELI